MEQWTLWLMLAIIVLPVTFIMIATPYLTRRTESFGVGITEEVYLSEPLKRIRSRYAITLGVLCAGILAAALLLVPLQDEQSMPYLMVGYVSAAGIAYFLLYLYNHNRMKQLKQKHGWQQPDMQRAVIDTRFRSRKPTLSNFWFVPHLVISAATFVIVFLMYDKFPATIAMQYDFQGQVTRSVDKTYFSLLLPVGFQLFMIALLMLVNTIISLSKQQLDKSDAAASTERSLIFRRSWSIMIVITGFLLTLMFSFIILTDLLGIPPLIMTLVPLLITGVILGGSIWLSVKVGQGGSRLKHVPANAAATGTGPSDDDKHWKLGIIYFNPADPALFLEKRFGVGWTMNLGRPLGMLLAILLLVIVALVIWLVPK